MSEQQISQEEREEKEAYLTKKYTSQIEDLMKTQGLTKQQTDQLNEVHKKLTNGFYKGTRF